MKVGTAADYHQWVPAEPTTRADAAESPRLGYLLKHVQLRFIELVSEALEPVRITAREWGALLCVDQDPPLSQAEIARQLGIDRTSMVALVDHMQDKGLVRRNPHRDDRRKNAVELTAAGRRTRQQAARRVDEVERQFLHRLTDREAAEFKRTLQTLIDDAH